MAAANVKPKTSNGLPFLASLHFLSILLLLGVAKEAFVRGIEFLVPFFIFLAKRAKFYMGKYVGFCRHLVQYFSRKNHLKAAPILWSLEAIIDRISKNISMVKYHLPPSASYS